jgi:hypothetical protein
MGNISKNRIASLTKYRVQQDSKQHSADVMYDIIEELEQLFSMFLPESL